MKFSFTETRPWLTAYALFVVLAVLGLIFLGGLVTSWSAGMAVPDWPLSFGSINPTGWWSNFPVRLEHGHRLAASVVGLLTMLLCAWVWRNKWLVGTTAVVAVGLILSFVLGTHHQQRSAAGTMQAGFWVAALIALVIGLFTLVLFTTSQPSEPGERVVRWLVYGAFVAVCLQATLGGLRVTGQTGGALQLALALRIFHGCVAQAFLCFVVAAAALLLPSWQEIAVSRAVKPSLRGWAWITVAAIYLQMVVGAVMRHLGAGLAIPSFPAASPTGSLLPTQHDRFTEINFTHTRIGSILVTLLILHVVASVWRAARGEPRLLWPAASLLALVCLQFTLGVLVVLHAQFFGANLIKPPTLTTIHVLNGAALLANALFLAMRLSRFASLNSSAADSASPHPQPLLA